MAAYEQIAGEYYDRERHPTSANLREGSLYLLHKFRHVIPDRGCLCEVGAGKATLDALVTNRQRYRDILILDQSASMLQHSRELRELGAHLIQADANNLPLRDSSVAALVCSLGDPYNQLQFWRDARRVLTGYGRILFTQPSFEWSSEYRDLASDHPRKAVFETRQGAHIGLPSFIHPPFEQIELMREAGLAVDLIAHFTLEQLAGPISKKLLIDRKSSLPIVTGYVGRKR